MQKTTKKVLSSKILFLIIALSFTSLTLNAQILVDESQCTAPDGYECGSKKGQKIEVIYPPGSLDQSFPPIVISRDCCVTSNRANACNVRSVGCSDTKK